MLQIKVNNSEFGFDEKSGEVIISNRPYSADVTKIDKNKFHVIVDNKSLNIELLEKSENGKSQLILINGKKHNAEIKDKYDILLHELGMDKIVTSKSGNLKAPMPGLVLRIDVKEGDSIKVGDSLIVLEAMKMENVIKAHGEGVVKKINVTLRQAVEKNTVLMEIE